MKHAKFSSWGFFLKKRRAEHFRSAREFYNKVALKISYPQYSRYEKGEQLPTLDQAIELFRFLHIPLLEGVLEWCVSQIQDRNTRLELLEPISKSKGFFKTDTKPSHFSQSFAETVHLDEVIVFNRSHRKLFSSDPCYRDLFTYINCCAQKWMSSIELSDALGISIERVRQMLQELHHLGVVNLRDDQAQVSKPLFYFPEDHEFFELKNQNLSHNFKSILERLKHSDLLQRKAFRGLYSRELNEAQLDVLIRKLDEIGNQMIKFSDSENSQRIYSLCLLLGERFSRPPAP